jgi:hypothetical protein
MTNLCPLAYSEDLLPSSIPLMGKNQGSIQNSPRELWGVYKSPLLPYYFLISLQEK